MESVELVGQQQLTIERTADLDTLRLYAAGGQLTLTLSITPNGPVLEVAGAGIMIRSSGPLAIDAQHVAIRGREGVVLHSDADALVSAARRLEMTAETQQMTATLGDVRVYANDDVVLDGERVRMNC
jgi:hypothetical protein